MGHFHQYLFYFVNHLTVFIEGIFALILILSVLWLLSNLKSESKDSSETDIKEIETALRRVLATTAPPRETARQAAKLIHDEDDEEDEIEKALKNELSIGELGGAPSAPVAPVKPKIVSLPETPPPAEAAAPTPPAPAPPAPAPAPVAEPKIVGVEAPSAVTTQTPTNEIAELEGLKTQLSAKDKEVSEAQSALAAAKAELEAAKKAQQENTAPNKEGDEKIRDLEAKLAEYQIIEDDIANLTLYKEENLRLKGELEKVKAVSTTATAAASELPEAVVGTATIESDKAVVVGEPKDSGQKLIEEFENFMKGAGG